MPSEKEEQVAPTLPLNRRMRRVQAHHEKLQQKKLQRSGGALNKAALLRVMRLGAPTLSALKETIRQSYNTGADMLAVYAALVCGFVLVQGLEKHLSDAQAAAWESAIEEGRGVLARGGPEGLHAAIELMLHS